MGHNSVRGEKKFFGGGLISARESSDWRVAILVLGGFRAWESYSMSLKMIMARFLLCGKGQLEKLTETWLFAWKWMEQEWNSVVYSEYGLYRGIHKRSWQSYRQKIVQKEHGCWREVANCELGTTKPQTYYVTFGFWPTWLCSNTKANKQNTRYTGIMKLQKHYDNL